MALLRLTTALLLVCAARLGADGGLEYGTLPAGTDFEAILARNRPQPV